MYPGIIFFHKSYYQFPLASIFAFGHCASLSLAVHRTYIVHCTWHFGALLLCMRDAIQLGFPNHFTYTQLAYILILSRACPST